ncbi:hypothetical protein M9Y10_026993 [Tritrichomonas musculus]|uniref:2'-5' RNA ligase family protein n=1 Tax=Tritrichomonas musculus TaxID=1915356 RepID=A0ABR2H576_9EUKA
MSSTNPIGNLYTVVCLVNGEAATFNDNLRREVNERFNAKLSTLPPHFTIKEGFKYDGDISDLVSTIATFCQNERARPYEIDGFGHFGKDVIFMNVELSNNAKAMHDRLIDAMSEIPYINFSEKDGKDKNFHITIASKQIKKIFDELYEFVNRKCCIFDCMFDNVTIFKWGDKKWDVYRQFSIPK